VAIIAVLLLHEKRRHPKLGAYPKNGDFTLLRESHAVATIAVLQLLTEKRRLAPIRNIAPLIYYLNCHVDTK
jgi:hypothetical protein